MAKQTRLGKLGFWGVEIGDWGTLLALIVSLGTLAWTAYDKFLVGPSPQLVPPEIVEFWCKDSSTDANLQREVCDKDANLLVRASTLTFLNKASSAHSYVVKALYVDVSFADAEAKSRKALRLFWQYFSEISISDKTRKPVAPFTVAGEAAVAKEIEFYPRREVIAVQGATLPAASDQDFYNYFDFQKLVSSGVITHIKFGFVASLFDSSAPIMAFCDVPVDQDFVRDAGASYALFSRECHS